MTNVIPLHACHKCGKPGKKPTMRGEDLGYPDIETVHIPWNMCEACMQKGYEGLEKQRVVFNALSDLGVSREVANAMMITKIDMEHED